VQDFSRAIELDPGNAIFLHNRGLVLRNMGKYEDAVRDYTLALKLDPKSVSAYENRGYSYRKLGNFEKAVSDYTKALNLDGSRIKTLNNRAFCYARSGMYAEAVRIFFRLQIFFTFYTSHTHTHIYIYTFHRLRTTQLSFDLIRRIAMHIIIVVYLMTRKAISRKPLQILRKF